MATVRRNTPTTGDLVVTLTSGDTTEATVPQTVTIRAGETSARFAVTGVQDGLTDGTRPVTLLAQAAGFNSGTVGLSVSDRNVADLQVTAIQLPNVVRTGGTVAMQFQVANTGFGATDRPWQDRVYVSADMVLDQNDVLVATLDSTPLGIGESYQRTVDFIAGQLAGEVHVIVVSDPQQALTELLDSNNARTATLTVAPAYTAVVSTPTTVAPAGTPIVMTGHATSAANGQGQAFSPVTIQVRTGDTLRTLTTVTNAAGDFTATFTPLPNEGGRYTISAGHPGQLERLPQDSFSLVAMKADPQGPSFTVTPGTPTEGDVTIRNLADVPLTGLAASVLGLPPILSVTLTAPPTIAADGSVKLHYVATSTGTYQTTGKVTFRLTTAEGATLDVPASVTVSPLAPVLLANPGYLEAGMLRGQQKLVTFEIVNQGGAATGPLTLQLPPNLPWLSAPSGTSLASLAPGERAQVTLALNPDADMPLA